MKIPGKFFISFGSRIVILDRFFASFVSRMGIPGRSFIPFGYRMRILAGFFVSFCSWMGIPVRSFIPFGSRIRIPARFLILRAHPKSDWYKDRLIFYHDSAALHEFGPVVASRNGSSFLSLMKEKKQKKIKAMIAISFYLVHVVNGRCLVRLGEESAIFAEELLLCSLYMRKKCLHFFRLYLVFVSKTCSNFGAMKRRESLPI